MACMSAQNAMNAMNAMNDFRQIRTESYRRIRPADLVAYPYGLHPEGASGRRD